MESEQVSVANHSEVTLHGLVHCCVRLSFGTVWNLTAAAAKHYLSEHGPGVEGTNTIVRSRSSHSQASRGRGSWPTSRTKRRTGSTSSRSMATATYAGPTICSFFSCMRALRGEMQMRRYVGCEWKLQFLSHTQARLREQFLAIRRTLRDFTGACPIEPQPVCI